MRKLWISTILAFSVASIFLVSSGKVEAAGNGSIYFSPSSYSVQPGQNITVVIAMSSGDDGEGGVQEVRSVIADFTYPTSKLQFVSISFSSSVFPVDGEGSASNGTVSITRHAESGDPVTGTGEVGRVTFKALAAGTASLQFTNDASLPTGYDNPADALGSVGPGTVNVSAYVVPGGSNLPSTGILDEVFNKFGVPIVLIGGAIFLPVADRYWADFLSRRKKFDRDYL